MRARLLTLALFAGLWACAQTAPPPATPASAPAAVQPAAKADAAPAEEPAPQPEPQVAPTTASTCTTAKDCRTFSNYCGGCACQALPAGATDPVCPGKIVSCLVDPCKFKALQCVSGACVLGDPES